jgi:hypothetical protein
VIHRHLSAVALAIPVVVILAACTVGPGATSASFLVSAGRPTTPSPPPSATPSIVPTPAASTGESATPRTEPPIATLVSAGRPGVVGDVGSYVIGTSGSDSPWLPGEPAAVGVGDRLTVTVEGVEVERWTARVGSAPDTDVRGLAEGIGPVRFDAPGRGRWSLSLRVFFPDGDVTYYWALSVR